MSGETLCDLLFEMFCHCLKRLDFPLELQRQYFITFSSVQLPDRLGLMNECREYSLRRDQECTQPISALNDHVRFGPVLEVVVIINAGLY